MFHSAHECSRVELLIEIEWDELPISKLNKPLTFVGECDRIETSTGMIEVVAIESVGCLRTYEEEVGDWGVVTNLFSIELGSIIVGALVRFTYDRIERL